METNQALTTAKRLLVYDDDDLYCRILERIGKKIGIKVVACSELEQFCAQANENQFDVVLIDYYLGHFIGPDLIKTIENKPAYLMSSSQEFIDKPQWWGQGVSGFLWKSLPPQTILQKVTGT